MTKTVVLVLGFCLLTSCATWENPETLNPFPVTKMSPDSVVLEIFSNVRTTGDDQTDLSWLVSDVDEQQLSPEVRKELAANGILCGVLGDRIPEAIHELLNSSSKKSESELLSPDNALLDPVYRRVHNPPGQRRDILLPTPKDSFTLLINKTGAVRGDTYHDAQSMLVLKSFPLGDGRVRLELTPEIHYGPSYSRPQGKNGVLKLVIERDRDSFDHLKMETILSPGQWMVVTASDEPVGMGKQFFTDDIDDRTVRRLILIRLAQTQHDDRLAPLQSELDSE